MATKSEMMQVKASDGQMPVFVATPTGAGPFPGVIVVMEAFGLNSHIKGVAERIAREGYVTAAPDLYYRSSDRTAGYDDLPKALGLMGGLFAIGLKHGRAGMLFVRANLNILLLNLVITFAVPGISRWGHIGGLIVGFAATWMIYTPAVRPTTA